MSRHHCTTGGFGGCDAPTEIFKHFEAYFEVTETQIKTNSQVFTLSGVHIEMEIASLKTLQRRTMH